ncbi:MAG: hypothetical protein AB1758_01800 [Candidatus Eremiobacterota bacterium]
MRITSTPPPVHARPLKMVAVGDSLTAGFQDATLVQDRQEYSYPNQIARAAGIPFRQPLIDGEGIPPRVFQGKDISVAPTIWRYLQVGVALSLPMASIALGFVPPEFVLWPLYYAGSMGKVVPGYETDTQNLAVPNFELRHVGDVANVKDLMRDMTERRSDMGGLMMLAPYVHSILQGQESASGGQSQIDRAVAQNPDLVIFWGGNNDALESVNGGVVDDRTLTPMDDQQWTYFSTGLFGTVSKTTEQVNPGFRTSMVGPNGALTRLLNETSAEIVTMTIPDVTVIPYLKTVGQKVGSLPFKVVLRDGTDVTRKVEDWVIPDLIDGPGHDGRTVFPAGTRVGLKTVLLKFLRSGEIFSEKELDERLNGLSAAGVALLEEDEVLTPDELGRIQQRTAEYNDLLRQSAAANPRVHLVDSGALLTRAMVSGLPLRGTGAEVTVTNVCAGLTDSRGFAGFFSFDGMHPSNVGHSVLANAVMDRVRADLGSNPKFKGLTTAPEIDERETFRQDPRNGGHNVLVLSGFHLAGSWGFT